MRRCIASTTTPRNLWLTSPLATRETLPSHHPRSNMSTTTREAKKTLRKEIKTRLSALTNEEVARQSRIAQGLIRTLPQYQQAKCIGLYLSMPTREARTKGLVYDALESGKKVFVPYIHSVEHANLATKKPGAGKVMDMLRLNSLAEFETLGRDSWGIPYLPSDSISERENAMGGVGTSRSDPEATSSGDKTAPNDGDGDGGLDLIIVPGVAFDTHMNRMGHGAGFYDSYLTRFCADGEGTHKKPFLVGLCLGEQLLQPGQIKMQGWDWKVDAVAVGDGRLLTFEEET